MTRESMPTPPDEAYWEALLVQGELPPSPRPRRPRKSSRRRLASPPLPPQPSESARKWNEGNPEDWERAEDDMHNHRILELPITDCNKGGVIVSYYSIQGFVPTSHMLNLPRLPDIEERLRVLGQKIGEMLRLRIIEIDRERGRLILSERAALEDENALRLWSTVKPGDILEGDVTRLEPYGAFVDVGGVEGLVHISELSWNRVDHPSDVVQVGDHVQVYVLGVKPNQRKIALSLKRLFPDPWEKVEDKFHPGDVLEGVVTHVARFGAFVRVDDGIEGLVHVSEMSENPRANPWNLVSVGEVVRVRVLQVDGANRRLALSLRQVE